ncbi:hypothetical protein [uncultured Tessaracoccus sp.]|uniref:hypothetical protein n=1 Tax=uncultured Tessaracoccus sp. TaxID=905023 RepID=UPI00261BAC46|nr:hypothetical protein [uncultured Tessaracoccus sp.]
MSEHQLSDEELFGDTPRRRLEPAVRAVALTGYLPPEFANLPELVQNAICDIAGFRRQAEYHERQAAGYREQEESRWEELIRGFPGEASPPVRG